MTFSQDRELYGVEMRAEPNYPTLGKKAAGISLSLLSSPLHLLLLSLAKVKSITQFIRDMSNADIEQLLTKDLQQTPLMIIEDIPIDYEDLHILYRVAQQTRFEATAEQGVRLFLFFPLSLSISSI